VTDLCAVSAAQFLICHKNQNVFLGYSARETGCIQLLPTNREVCFIEQVGEKLGKAEVEKRQAIDSENYDKAKSKKQQMDDYRHLAYEKLRVNDLLDASMIPVSTLF
jgi:hypothetical protein